MKIESQQLKAFLLDAKLVSEDRFERAKKIAEKNNQKIGEVLVSEGLITQEKLLKLEAYILGIPFIDLEKETIDSDI